MRIETASGRQIALGIQGENLATQVVFPIGKWIDQHGDTGTFSLVAQRKGDTDPYPVVLVRDDENVLWNVTSADTAVAGNGVCELQYRIGEVLAKSVKWDTRVYPSLSDVGEAPDPYETWIDTLEALGAETQQNATSASNSADSAGASATSASESATAAATSAESAAASATAAEQSVTSAAVFATSSATSATAAPSDMAPQSGIRYCIFSTWHKGSDG